jgi:hypothetical protein
MAKGQSFTKRGVPPNATKEIPEPGSGKNKLPPAAGWVSHELYSEKGVLLERGYWRISSKV